MARLLVNDKWHEDIDLRGKTVANVIDALVEEEVLSTQVHEWGIKADGVVLMGGEVIEGQEVLEIIEVPQIADPEDQGVQEDSSVNVFGTEHPSDK